MANQQKLPLHLVQKDPVELERCIKDPVYFYNKYVRIEGEKILNAEEYAAHVAAVKRFNDATRAPLIMNPDAIPKLEVKDFMKAWEQAHYWVRAVRDEAEGATLEAFEASKPKEDFDTKGKPIITGTAGEFSPRLEDIENSTDATIQPTEDN